MQKHFSLEARVGIGRLNTYSGHKLSRVLCEYKYNFDLSKLNLLWQFAGTFAGNLQSEDPIPKQRANAHWLSK